MTTESDSLREEIRRRYADAAAVAAGGHRATDGPEDACLGTTLYDNLEGVPEGAGLASLGCARCSTSLGGTRPRQALRT